MAEAHEGIKICNGTKIRLSDMDCKKVDGAGTLLVNRNGNKIGVTYTTPITGDTIYGEKDLSGGQEFTFGRSPTNDLNISTMETQVLSRQAAKFVIRDGQLFFISLSNNNRPTIDGPSQARGNVLSEDFLTALKNAFYTADVKLDSHSATTPQDLIRNALKNNKVDKVKGVFIDNPTLASAVRESGLSEPLKNVIGVASGMSIGKVR